MRDFFTPRAQARASPQIDDERARHLAVGLQIAADHLVGGESAEVEGGAGRQRARVGSEEIAAGGKDVAPAALGGARRAGRNSPSVKRGDDRRALGRGACLPPRIGVRRGATVDVLSVLDAHVLEVAQPRIDTAQRLVGIGVLRNACFVRQSGAFRMLDDEPREALAPTPVEAVGLRVFIDQPLQLAQIAADAAGDERGRRVADRHRGDPALCLCRFPRIADDERIDDGQGAHDRFGVAAFAQGYGLAR